MSFINKMPKHTDAADSESWSATAAVGAAPAVALLGSVTGAIPVATALTGAIGETGSSRKIYQ